MINYIQPGKILDLVAPAAVSSGDGVKVGQIFGVAVADAANGAAVQLAVEGVFELPCLGSDDIGAGDLLYWDNGNSRLTLTATSNLLVGAAVADAGTGVTAAKVLLSTGPRPQESA